MSVPLTNGQINPGIKNDADEEILVQIFSGLDDRYEKELQRVVNQMAAANRLREESENNS
ncbi:MAG: hypothetical protein Q4A82_07530 [Corynebacterium sp.]|nr:hypothetical protein [Corynebacterium sp.]